MGDVCGHEVRFVCAIVCVCFENCAVFHRGIGCAVQSILKLRVQVNTSCTPTGSQKSFEERGFWRPASTVRALRLRACDHKRLGTLRFRVLALVLVLFECEQRYLLLRRASCLLGAQRTAWRVVEVEATAKEARPKPSPASRVVEVEATHLPASYGTFWKLAASGLNSGTSMNCRNRLDRRLRSASRLLSLRPRRIRSSCEGWKRA